MERGGNGCVCKIALYGLGRATFAGIFFSFFSFFFFRFDEVLTDRINIILCFGPVNSCLLPGYDRTVSPRPPCVRFLTLTFTPTTLL